MNLHTGGSCHDAAGAARPRADPDGAGRLIFTGHLRPRARARRLQPPARSGTSGTPRNRPPSCLFLTEVSPWRARGSEAPAPAGVLALESGRDTWARGAPHLSRPTCSPPRRWLPGGRDRSTTTRCRSRSHDGHRALDRGREASASAPSWDNAASAELRLPAEAFVRLVYGRLDPDHTPGDVDVEVSSSTCCGAPGPASEPTRRRVEQRLGVGTRLRVAEPARVELGQRRRRVLSSTHGSRAAVVDAASAARLHPAADVARSRGPGCSSGRRGRP